MEIRSKIQDIKLYLRITKANKIARRYFIMNSFDGIVTILGVITGSFVSNVIDPAVILGIGISTAIAMAISGITGTFMAEKAERDIEISELEASMLSDLKNTIYAKAVKFTIFYVSTVDALSPVLASLVTLVPIFLALIGIVPALTGIYLAEAVGLLYLFILGSAMARIIKKNMLLEGLKMLLVGLATAVVIIFIFGLSP